MITIRMAGPFKWPGFSKHLDPSGRGRKGSASRLLGSNQTLVRECHSTGVPRPNALIGETVSETHRLRH